MAKFTIYFATDIHGSERCFLKFLNAGKAYLTGVFDRVVRDATTRWVEIADTRLKEAGLPCPVMPGNDDVPEVKDVLAEGRWRALAASRPTPPLFTPCVTQTGANRAAK